ncbi:TIGR03915 family putative DNA repair protein [Enterococcus sp. AZ109]|uniref:TIGR03915 family putative DNA repair protein n=1 Tax=Enterococcus sp. AZ109 TaxID=2774634 RepID=UPI003F228483
MRETQETWEYDGSFYGFLCLVDRAFSQKNVPALILTPETALESLFLGDWIETNEIRAQKIYRRLQQRLTAENLQFVQTGFYATLAGKERCLLDVIEIALGTKDSLENFIGHPSVLAVKKAIKTLLGEVHLFTGFVRFEYVGKILFSKIAPKHYSLPFLCPHFAERYPNEQMMIYDETHRLLAMLDHGRITLIEDSECPEIKATDEEQVIQNQWRAFLAAVTINERTNRQVQMGHLPLRFRGNMVEFD